MFNKYFQDELAYLRELGREFSQAYPTLAPMLADRGVDPDVERLLEGVAFLTGRIRQKLDDEVPEFLQSLGAPALPAPDAAAAQRVDPRDHAHRQRPARDPRRQGGNGVRERARRRHAVHVPLVDRLRALARRHRGRPPRARCPAAGSRSAITLRSMSGAPLAHALPHTLRLHFTGEPQRRLRAALRGQPAARRRDAGARAGRGPRASCRSGTTVVRWVGFEEDEGAACPSGGTSSRASACSRSTTCCRRSSPSSTSDDVRRVVELDKETRPRMTLALRLDRPLPPTMRVTHAERQAPLRPDRQRLRDDGGAHPPHRRRASASSCARRACRRRTARSTPSTTCRRSCGARPTG